MANSDLTSVLQKLSESFEKNNELLQQNLSAFQEVIAAKNKLPEDDSDLIRDKIMKARQGKTLVEVRVDVLKVGDVDTKKQEYIADVQLEARWEEPGLASQSGEELEDFDYEGIWDPKLVILNMDQLPKADKHWFDFEVSDSGPVVVFRRKIKGTFYENLELRQFPFDVQGLSLHIITEHPAREVTLQLNELNASRVDVNSFRDQDEWTLFRVVKQKIETFSPNINTSVIELRRPENMEKGSVSMIPMTAGIKPSKQKVIVDCYVARNVGYWIWNVFLFLFLINCLTFIPFSYDHTRTSSRLGVMMSLLFTTVAKKMAIGTQLPAISYLTYLDVYIMSVFGFLSLQALQFAVASIWVRTGDDELVKAIDYYSMIAMATILLTFNIFYGVYVYVVAGSKRWKLLKQDKAMAAKEMGRLNQGRLGEREKLV